MKITKESLKKIIGEELEKMQELGGQMGMPKGDNREKTISDINNILNRLDDHSVSIVLRYLIEMMSNLDTRKDENQETE